MREPAGSSHITTMNQPMIVKSVTVDSPLRGDVDVIFRAGMDDAPVRVTLDAPLLLNLVAKLSGLAPHVVSWAANSALVGDCGACGNTGLVTETNHRGREERFHCPECHERRGTEFPPYARVGGGVR